MALASDVPHLLLRCISGYRHALLAIEMPPLAAISVCRDALAAETHFWLHRYNFCYRELALAVETQRISIGCRDTALAAEMQPVHILLRVTLIVVRYSSVYIHI